MWCRKCYTEISERECPKCHSPAIAVPQHGVYWCHHCNIPVLIEAHREENYHSDMTCPLCKKTIAYLSSDLRPVFPEERLLIELLLGKKPNEWIENSVWATNSQYYVNGKKISISTKQFQNAAVFKLQSLLEKHKEQNSYLAFDRYMKKFVSANVGRLNYIKQEVTDFIRQHFANRTPAGEGAADRTGIRNWVWQLMLPYPAFQSGLSVLFLSSSVKFSCPIKALSLQEVIMLDGTIISEPEEDCPPINFEISTTASLGSLLIGFHPLYIIVIYTIIAISVAEIP